MTTASKTSARALRPLIQKMLDDWCKRHRTTFTLRIEEVLKQYEWTIFIVKPAKGEVHAYEYASALADVETELRRKKGVENVLVLPALPD